MADELDCVFFSDAASAKLSTFVPARTNAVQLRRPTNKKGKTAPAPPKRTRYLFLADPLSWNSREIVFIFGLTFRSLLSSCSSFRDSQYGNGAGNATGSHEFDSNMLCHGNQMNSEADGSFVNGQLDLLMRWEDEINDRL